MKDNFIRTTPVLEVTTPQLASKRHTTRGNSRLQWGTTGSDGFGNQVFAIYQKSQLLRSIIELILSELTSTYSTQEIIKSYILYGFAVIRKADMALLDTRYIRTNSTRSKFWYRLPATSEEVYTADEVIFVCSTGVSSDMPYPTPLVYPILQSVQTLNSIDDWHVNEITNGFSSQVMISLCNGIPSEEERNEIEEGIFSKYAGAENAGRIVLNFCDDLEHSAKVEAVPITDYQARFESLTKYCVNQIYSIFHITPSLLGLVEGLSTGFNDVEYRSQLCLFNHFTIKPLSTLCKRFNLRLDPPTETLKDVLLMMSEEGLDAKKTTTVKDEEIVEDKNVTENPQ